MLNRIWHLEPMALSMARLGPNSASASPVNPGGTPISAWQNWWTTNIACGLGSQRCTTACWLDPSRVQENFFSGFLSKGYVTQIYQGCLCWTCFWEGVVDAWVNGLPNSHCFTSCQESFGHKNNLWTCMNGFMFVSHGRVLKIWLTAPWQLPDAVVTNWYQSCFGGLHCCAGAPVRWISR
jgi:hypothetical protein